MHLFIEKGMRGGISMVSKRHIKANNPHVTGYSPEEGDNYIMYYDANNPYGWANTPPALLISGYETQKVHRILEFNEKTLDGTIHSSKHRISQKSNVCIRKRFLQTYE